MKEVNIILESVGRYCIRYDGYMDTSLVYKTKKEALAAAQQWAMERGDKIKIK
jgi:hypothetical protein